MNLILEPGQYVFHFEHHILKRHKGLTAFVIVHPEITRLAGLLTILYKFTKAFVHSGSITFLRYLSIAILDFHHAKEPVGMSGCVRSYVEFEPEFDYKSGAIVRPL
jgi:hypothetical protein